MDVLRKMKPTIAIVIPTYNGRQYVEESIQSALAQTRPADEIIISDDNSSDDTLDICRKYADRVRIVRNENGPSGFVNGWNFAISLAKSDYISILHQDDLIAPNFLEEIEHAIIQHSDVRHLFTPCKLIDGEGLEIKRELKHCTGDIRRYTGQEYAEDYVLTPGHIHRCPGVVTHRDIFRQCQYRAEAGHIADNDFFIRVGLYTDVVGVMKPLASYREHNQSETGHLDHLVINKRLLDDYHFQLEHADENPMMSERIIEIFRLWESQYIHRLIVYGLKRGKFKYVSSAIKNWFTFKKGCKFGNIAYDLKRVCRF